MALLGKLENRLKARDPKVEQNTHKNLENQPKTHIKMGLKREFQPQSGGE